MSSTEPAYDLVVIGGGINGAGIARDAALRGMRVLLLEARDFGSGTSSWSSRLIHGGLRYLEYGEIPLVYESLHERRCLRRIASHLVRPLRITIPLYRGGRRPPWLVRAGMLAYDLLSLGKSLPRHRMLSRDELLAAEPGVNPRNLRGAAQYYDAQVTYAERLVMENILAAAAAGADVRNYTPVTGIESGGDLGCRVRFRGPGGPRACVASARTVVNAAGPWVDRVLATSGAEVPRLMGGTKGSHIVVGAFEGAPRDGFYVEAARDGRPVFILPWNEQYLIGTTDIRYDDDPADARASIDEVRYLLDAANAVFPAARLSAGDIHYTYAGIRPLPYQSEGPESAITRRHIIHDHGPAIPGLLSVIGGKLTTYRSLAEQVVDRVAARVPGRQRDCRSDAWLLPGAVAADAANAALAAFPALSEAGRHRLLSVYGGRCGRLAQLAAADPRLAATLDADCTVVAAEVALAVREEFARTLVDMVHRRLMIGLRADQGASAGDAVLAVAARECRWSAAQSEAERQALRTYNRRLKSAVSDGPQSPL
ncbi:MAG TPA: glycerol-3-phosphate dehydrogenase [Woeseiaceae bacterium]|nr:glycerol-3-phosphate dehydrogenase [Woeseiaceae bacterium]